MAITIPAAIGFLVNMFPVIVAPTPTETTETGGEEDGDVNREN